MEIEKEGFFFKLCHLKWAPEEFLQSITDILSLAPDSIIKGALMEIIEALLTDGVPTTDECYIIH